MNESAKLPALHHLFREMYTIRIAEPASSKQNVFCNLRIVDFLLNQTYLKNIKKNQIKWTKITGNEAPRRKVKTVDFADISFKKYNSVKKILFEADEKLTDFTSEICYLMGRVAIHTKWFYTGENLSDELRTRDMRENHNEKVKLLEKEYKERNNFHNAFTSGLIKGKKIVAVNFASATGNFTCGQWLVDAIAVLYKEGKFDNLRGFEPTSTTEADINRLYLYTPAQRLYDFFTYIMEPEMYPATKSTALTTLAKHAIVKIYSYYGIFKIDFTGVDKEVEDAREKVIWHYLAQNKNISRSTHSDERILQLAGWNERIKRKELESLIQIDVEGKDEVIPQFENDLKKITNWIGNNNNTRTNLPSATAEQILTLLTPQ